MTELTGIWKREEPNRHYCPYCRTVLNTYKLIVEIVYEKPIPPPTGAKDLGLKEKKSESYGSFFGACSKCRAKYRIAEEYDGERGGIYYNYHSVKSFPKKKAQRDYLIQLRNISPAYPMLKDEIRVEYPDPEHKLVQNEGCFIATAVYGSSEASEVRILRKFRDEFLLKFLLGELFVRCYYRISPYLAERLEGRTEIRAFIKKTVLDPIVSFISKDQF